MQYRICRGTAPIDGAICAATGFGVIEPGAQAAADSASQGSVLVLATEGTVMDSAYQRALLAVNPKLAVHARACPLWWRWQSRNTPRCRKSQKVLPRRCWLTRYVGLISNPLRCCSVARIFRCSRKTQRFLPQFAHCGLCANHGQTSGGRNATFRTAQCRYRRGRNYFFSHRRC